MAEFKFAIPDGTYTFSIKELTDQEGYLVFQGLSTSEVSIDTMKESNNG